MSLVCSGLSPRCVVAAADMGRIKPAAKGTRILCIVVSSQIAPFQKYVILSRSRRLTSILGATVLSPLATVGKLLPNTPGASCRHLVSVELYTNQLR